MSKLRHVGTVIFANRLLAAVAMITFIGFAALVPRVATAEDDHPVCGEEESIGKHCWAHLTNPPGCRFFSMQRRDVDTDAAWSGLCEDGRATGPGVLSDNAGNHAEGLFVAGRRDGLWRWRFADGVTREMTYADGLANGPVEMTFPEGRHIQGHYEDNVRVGTWKTRWKDGYSEAGPYVENIRHGTWTATWPDGYSEVGPVEEGTRHGTWTVTWPDGHEAVVPYVEGQIHGDVTVTHEGAPLGVLVYREGERIGPGLPPVLLPPLPDP